MAAQKYLQTYYDQRAEQRAHHARRAAGAVGGPLRRGVPARAPAGGGGAVSSELAVATVYEAAGREGLIDVALHRIVPGSRAAGPARPVRCGQGDNLMVHAAIAHARPGDVLVLTMPEPAPVALVGDLLATQAQAQGVAAILVDGAVRDADELAELGLPIWARWIRVRGATQGRRRARSTSRSTVGGARIAAGDLVVLDGDGAAVVAAGAGRRGARRRRRARGARAREAREAAGAARCPTTSTTCASASNERPRPHPPRRAAHPRAGAEPRLLPRRARDGDRVARGPVGLPARLGRVPAATRSS